MNCRACKDPIEREDLVHTDGYCRECYEEIAKGIIPMVTGPTHQAHASHLTPRQAAKLGSTTGG